MAKSILEVPPPFDKLRAGFLNAKIYVKISNPLEMANPELARSEARVYGGFTPSFYAFENYKNVKKKGV